MSDALASLIQSSAKQDVLGNLHSILLPEEGVQQHGVVGCLSLGECGRLCQLRMGSKYLHVGNVGPLKFTFQATGGLVPAASWYVQRGGAHLAGCPKMGGPVCAHTCQMPEAGLVPCPACNSWLNWTEVVLGSQWCFLPQGLVGRRGIERRGALLGSYRKGLFSSNPCKSHQKVLFASLFVTRILHGLSSTALKFITATVWKRTIAEE